MKKVRGGVLASVGMLAIAALLFFLRQGDTQKNWQQTATRSPGPPVENETPAPDEIPAQTNPPAITKNFAKRSADMTVDEKTRLAHDFKQNYQPAAEKWFKAYEGRIPFKLEDFTFDKFHSRIGHFTFTYTFMIGDTTFVIQDSKQGAKVSYLMTRKGAKELNQVPGPGFVPDLRIPVSRQDIIRMVKADSGIEFKPNEVIIKPTAAASALNGGAFVDILPAGKDPNNALNFKISMVFDSDGHLINYERDPFF